MDAPSADSLTAADQAFAGLDHMLITRHTDYDAGTLHYSTAAALVRRWPARYVIERIGRQRRIRRITDPEPEVMRREYMLAADPIKPGGPLTRREILQITGDGHRSVFAVVADADAVDVLEAIRRAYQNGLEDKAGLSPADSETEREFGTPRVRVLYGMRFADIDGMEWVGLTLVAEYAGMQPGQAAEVLAELVAAGLVERRGHDDAWRLTS